jgi:membrane protein implicated in regulation of membrane protease activity
MGLGVSLILIAVGAILTWAVEASVSGLDITAIGVILMIVGLVGGLLSLLFWSTWWGPGYFRGYAEAPAGPSTRRVRRRRVAAAPADDVEEVVEERY